MLCCAVTKVSAAVDAAVVDDVAVAVDSWSAGTIDHFDGTLLPHNRRMSRMIVLPCPDAVGSHMLILLPI